MSDIPVLRMGSPTFGADMIGAAEDVGFFSVVDHGLDPDLFDRMRSLCGELFALSEQAKVRLRITPDNYRGFIPLGFFTPNRAEANGTAPDRYEGFKLHWECPPGAAVGAECELYGSNRWPDELPEMAKTVAEYWTACEGLAETLLQTFAPALHVSTDALVRWHTETLTNMTLLHYPSQSAADPATGIHPHKDTNVLTFLHPDPVGGLEVRATDGSWIDVHAPADAMLVNTGEMLELWSGGRFPATPHRVVNRSGRERYSFPWFLVPRHDVVVEPLVEPVPGFDRSPMPVGALSAEVWRTNWADEKPSIAGHDLGTLDR
jgi:isopenicillin N synthase-like dioxygenase